MKRSKVESTYNMRYREVPNLYGRCFYCGEPSIGVDHIPPLVIVSKLGYDECVKLGAEFVLVPCCSECNSILGDLFLLNHIEREQHIRSELKRRYGKLAARTPWLTHEIDNLGYNLQSAVLAGENERRRAVSRLHWASQVVEG